MKLSSPAQTLTRRLEAKNPDPSPAVSAIPNSKKVFGVRRALAFGFNNFLKAENTEVGIDPLEAGVGGGWGGCAVAGSDCDGLKAK